MATLVLSTVGSVVGQTLGGPIGAAIGRTVGTLAGTYIDSKVFGGSGSGSKHLSQNTEGPRLDEAQITTSTEGAAIPRVYGRYRVAGQIIWATRLRENVVTTTETTTSGGGGGGKGGGGQRGGGSTTTTTTRTSYEYFANFAVGLCEGVVGSLGRVWADGKELDINQYTYRFYRGTQTQTPDSLIEAKEGAGNVPGYRGLSYIVFEDMPLARFGNRIPQMLFEVLRPIAAANSVETRVPGVAIMPGSTEHGYDPEIVTQEYRSSSGSVIQENIENSHLKQGKSNWQESIDQLQQTLPSCDLASLVVSWFGDDLRAGQCTIKPRVEDNSKVTVPHAWRSGALTYSSAQEVSQVNGIAAFGGSPSDASIIRAVGDLKARNIRVMMYPFLLMDVATGNTLPNPYSDNASSTGQPDYPWRGRITVSPARGSAGTVDKTSTAAEQVASFYGTATASDFSGSGTTLSYSGPNEWSYSRFILHMAQLCKMAGGVDYFCIGSEMVEMTRARSAAEAFPFVDSLRTLAAEVATLLPGAKIGYGADWSEYNAFRPSDGSEDVFFNLDPLWADDNIHFVGIDNYMKLSDWRDGRDHTDFKVGGNPSGFDLDYLMSNIEGGEDYDWFYASDSDRSLQSRTPITDSEFGKPWVYRQKDIKNWWLNQHYNRPSGVEDSSPTDWVPQSKPILFTELGCPAIDKGSNQPNVFLDPKSSESAVPYYSSGARDDVIPRRFLEAHFDYWADGSNNPTSTEYSGKMIDENSIVVWCWDARPWPTFPLDDNWWADKENWQYGHWLNSRMGTVYIPDLLSKLAEEYDTTLFDFSRAYGACDGFVIDTVMSLRDAVEPLTLVYMFDVVESGGLLKAVSRIESQSVLTLTEESVARSSEGEDVTMVRRQETEIPAVVNITFLDTDNSYKSTSAQARRLNVKSEGVSYSSVPIITDYSRAQQAVDTMLYDLWAARETATLGVLPRHIELEPADVVTLSLGDFAQEVRITSITDGISRTIEATTFDRAAWVPAPTDSKTIPNIPDPTIASPIVEIMDLPMLTDRSVEYMGYAAGYGNPWPSGINIYRSPSTSNYQLNTVLGAPANIGETRSVVGRGPEGRWDYGTVIRVEMYDTQLSSLDDESVLAGANTIAIKNSSDAWEIIQFAKAELVSPGVYDLSKLLRGQKGTESAMEDALPIGARVVVLDLAVTQLNMELSDVGLALNYRFGPATRAISDTLYTSETETITGIGMRPYSPVHVSGKLSSGDWTITWRRRTRIGGDNWGYTEDVPLSETEERYEVDVLGDSDTVVRTLSSNSASATYTSAQMSTDSISAPFDVVVYQISETFGRGTGRRKTLNG